MADPTLLPSQDVARCPWVDLTKPDYVAYHDTEWGVPVHDDGLLFEYLTLESAQAGLSWYTVLRKREGYRKAFANFDVNRVARFSEQQMEALQTFEGIIRNRLKIRAAVTNAQCFLRVQEEFGSFDNYIWDFVDGKPIINCWASASDFPSTSKESDALSKDLKKRGFKFVGSTIMYAHMQATGMVMDHTMDCFRRAEILKAAS